MPDAAVMSKEACLEIESEDAAWASVNTPLQEDELLEFCRTDIERLFRINPYLEFEDWSQQDETHYRLLGRNHSQDEPFDVDISIQVEETGDGLQLYYSGGIKRDTTFKIKPSPYGSNLTIHESYLPVTGEERGQMLDQVDRSLATWAEDIQKYIVTWKKWRWFGPWRWYMRRVWQRMKPSGRRIAYIFWWITLVEIALMALGVGIYWVEYR